MTEQVQTTRRGWNLRIVTLECPTCRRRKSARADPSDPPRTALVRAVCNECPDDAAVIDYFDAYGNQIDGQGRPLRG